MGLRLHTCSKFRLNRAGVDGQEYLDTIVLSSRNIDNHCTGNSIRDDTLHSGVGHCLPMVDMVHNSTSQESPEMRGCIERIQEIQEQTCDIGWH